MDALEKDHEQAARRLCKRIGWLIIKFAHPTEKGWPDRIMAKYGRLFFVEFKRTLNEGKKATQLRATQTYVKNLLSRVGVQVEVVPSYAHFVDLVLRWEREYGTNNEEVLELLEYEQQR